MWSQPLSLLPVEDRKALVRNRRVMILLSMTAPMLNCVAQAVLIEKWKSF